MKTECLVDGCGRPTPDQAYVCQGHADRLERALGDVPALWEELDTVLTKQARYAAAEFRRGEQALPFNPIASELGYVLRNTLSTWCRLISEERGKALPEGEDPPPPVVAGWLLHHTTWLRHHRAGHEAVEEITSVVKAVGKAVDRPRPRIYAGPCRDCGGDLYGEPGDVSVECRPCGLSYDVAEMLEWMRGQVYGRLVTAKEGVVLLSRFGLPVQQKTIDKWFERKRLSEHGHDPAGKRLYLFDDLVTLAAANAPAERAS